MNTDGAPDTTKGLEHHLVPIPANGDDVCPSCRSWRHARFDYCSNCLEILGTLSRPCGAIIPITMYSKPSLLRDIVTFYKPGNDRYEPKYEDYVSAILYRFLTVNHRRIVTIVGDYDTVTWVPSSHSPKNHPFFRILQMYDGFDGPVVETLERGPGQLGKRVMSDDAFAVTHDVKGKKILLLDDVFTTGAHLQSAASALQLAGATVRSAVVFARRINPDFNLASQALWDRQQAIPYNFNTAVDWLERCTVVHWQRS